MLPSQRPFIAVICVAAAYTTAANAENTQLPLRDTLLEKGTWYFKLDVLEAFDFDAEQRKKYNAFTIDGERVFLPNGTIIETITMRIDQQGLFGIVRKNEYVVKSVGTWEVFGENFLVLRSISVGVEKADIYNRFVDRTQLAEQAKEVWPFNANWRVTRIDAGRLEIAMENMTDRDGDKILLVMKAREKAASYPIANDLPNDDRSQENYRSRHP